MGATTFLQLMYCITLKVIDKFEMNHVLLLSLSQIISREDFIFHDICHRSQTCPSLENRAI